MTMRYASSLLMGMSHFGVDASTALILFSFASVSLVGQEAFSKEQFVVLLVVYNGIAFFAQPLFGYVLDRFAHRGPSLRIRYSQALQVALVCMMLALGGRIVLGYDETTVGIDSRDVRIVFMILTVISGFGSALFHVSAGALSQERELQDATSLGVFTAPGVFGLSVGIIFSQYLVDLGLLLLLFGNGAILVAVLSLEQRERQEFSEKQGRQTKIALPHESSQAVRTAHLKTITPFTEKLTSLSERMTAAFNRSLAKKRYRNAFGVKTLSILVAGLFIIGIALRSALWSTVETAYHHSAMSLMVLGLTAATGKLLGGYLSDQMGWLRYTLIAVVMVGFMGLSHTETIGGLLLIFFLQSLTPVMMAGMLRLSDKHRALLSGCALGFAIALGGAIHVLNQIK